MFSEATLAEIRNGLNIVDVIGEYLTLKKSGQGYVGLCPFHGERTPSFHVHPLKQCFHCFGCQKGGNVFTFVSTIEGLNFPETVEKLAKRVGVVLESQPRKSYKPIENKIPPTLLETLKWATKYYHYLLMKVPEYRFAQDYLKSRGISEKTMEKFQLGVSPKGWNTLLDLMLKRKFRFEDLTQSGLIVQKDGSPTQGYDRFRNRLMFPIFDNEGNGIGFGGRLLGQEENQPKYVNSSESPLFSKRRTLYGLYENQRGIRVRGEAIIVEGYMDVVGLYECGVNNAVATMGTALTEEHCQQLKLITNRVVTVFDPDPSGQEAWRRSVHLLISYGLFAKDLSLPDNKDPDEFVLAEGAEKFYKMCEKAPRQVTKLLREIAARGPLSEEESGRLLTDLTPILIASRRLPDKAMLWDDISLLLKVSLAALKDLVETSQKAPARKEAAQTPAPAPKPTAQPIKEKTLDPLDFEFFQACLQSLTNFQQIPLEDWVGGLREAGVKKWLLLLHEACPSNERENVLEEILRTETNPKLLAATSAVAFEESVGDKKSPLFAALLERVQKRKRELEIKSLSAQVKLTQRLGDDGEQMRLLEKLKHLRAP